MPRRLVRYSFAFALLWSSQALALGLGEIRIDSALNEPLRAEIELLAASPDELIDLKITLASDATFERYGLDRPFFLSELQFQIFRTGRAEGNVIRVTSPSPITEPFVTFLIERYRDKSPAQFFNSPGNTGVVGIAKLVAAENNHHGIFGQGYWLSPKNKGAAPLLGVAPQVNSSSD